MKKNKNKIEKNKKVKEKKKKKKLKVRWKTWMTVVAVFFGVFLITGSTVLGVYLSGGFDEDIVYPSEIAFSYDADLFNGGRLEVDSDFSLTITSPTEHITRGRVALSFQGQSVSPVDGKISNGSIQVPQNVTIGEPFTVHLLTTYLVGDDDEPIMDGDKYIDWIVGGISTLVATSEYNRINPVSITIAVDVPVYDTKPVVINSRGEETNKIVKNESFRVETKFIPTNSKYMFSDDKRAGVEPRLKKSYYEAVNTTDLRTVYDNKDELHFVALDKIVSDEIVINSYTFINSKNQLNYERENGDIDDAVLYYTNILSYLSENVEVFVKRQEARFTIGEEDIGTFKVAKESQSIKFNIENPLRLYLNSYPYQSNSDYIGATVESRSGYRLDNLLPNIAISFEKSDKTDPTQGVGKILTVSKYGQSVVIGDKTYYKPYYEEGMDSRYAYWDLSAEEIGELTIKVVLIQADNKLFKELNTDKDLIREITLSLTKHEEKSINWTDLEEMDVKLKYETSEGVSKIVPENIYLNQFISIPDENIYKDYVFFAYFGTGNITDEGYIENVENIIGKGYDLKRSGTYNVPSAGGLITLVALTDNKVTLYSTARISIYCATIKGEYTSEGLYQFAEITSNPKIINCEKSLYDESVTSYIADYTVYVAGGQEKSIDLGNSEAFNISFIIENDSVPVFTEEYNEDHILKPRIFSNSGRDISEFFSFEAVGLHTTNIDDDREVTVLEYKITPSSTSLYIEDEQGIYFGRYELEFNNGEQSIIWQISLNDGEIVSLYKPEAKDISIKDSEILKEILNLNEREERITVDQDLTETGEFSVKIKVGEQPIIEDSSEFVTQLVANNKSFITILDQKGKDSTLKDKWSFIVDSGDPQIIEFKNNNQGFTFRNTRFNEYKPLSLIIRSNDGYATLKVEGEILRLNFNIKSVGITKIRTDNEKKTYEHNLTDSDSINEALIHKYGAKGDEGQTIILSDLIEFYVRDQDEEREFENVIFKFSSQYYSIGNLTDKEIIDLFGDQGMLSLYSDATDTAVYFSDNTAETIRNTLNNVTLHHIKINKDFAITHILQLQISDKGGAVDTRLDLVLDPNISALTNKFEEYAGTAININDANTDKNIVVTFNNSSQEENLEDLYENETYYIVPQNRMYVLSKTASAGAVGTFKPKEGVTFYDFWDTNLNVYTIHFQPDGSNLFTLDAAIQFTIKRDLKIDTKAEGNDYYILDGDQKINNFITFKRMSSGAAIGNFKVAYEFDKFLKVEDGNICLIPGEKGLFFDYNEKTLTATMTIHYETIEGSVLGTVKFNISLSKNDIYEEVAKLFTDGSISQTNNIEAIVQEVNGVEYLMFALNCGNIWTVKELSYGTAAQAQYSIISGQQDYYGELNCYDYLGDGSIQFKSYNQLLYGLGDENVYISLQFRKKEEGAVDIAFMHVPIILSKIGYDSVIYQREGLELDVKKRLQLALTDPNTMIDSLENAPVSEKILFRDIYAEISAGQFTEILSQYEMKDYLENAFFSRSNITEGGLYTLSSLTPQIEVYPLSGEFEDYSSLVKRVDIGRAEGDSGVAGPIEGNVLLNHLTTLETSSYFDSPFVALKYTLQDTAGQSVTFYYLLKVKPDVKIEDTIYAYGGSTEYVKGDTTQSLPINFEELYSNKTLFEDQKRFIVTKSVTLASGSTTLAIEFLSGQNKAKILAIYGSEKKIISVESDIATAQVNLSETFTNISGEVKLAILQGNIKISYNNQEILRTLRYTNEVEWVKVGTETYTNGQWSDTIDLSWSDDQSTLYYKPKVTSEITLQVKHTYTGSSNYLDNDLSVLGGEQYYNIVINESDDIYSVQLVNKGSTEEKEEFVIEINNEQENKTYEMDVFLLRTGAAGSSSEKTKVFQELDINITTGGEFLKESGEKFSYNNSTGKFIIYLKDYIESDSEVTFAAYTKQGYLATIKIKLKANVTYTAILTELKGGETKTNAQLFSLKKTSDNSQLSGYSVTAQIKSGTGKDLVKYTDSGLTISDLISDKTVTIAFTVTFTGDTYKGKTFTFEQTYTLKQNITPYEAVSVAEQVLGGGTKQITETLFGGTAENTKVSYEATLRNTAFDYIDGSTIHLNYVDKEGSLEIPLKVILTFNNGSSSTTQEFTVRYTLVVAPSVKLEVNYPKPNSETKIKYEYVENGSEFNNILSDFFKHNPIFGENNRVVVKQGSIDGSSKKAVYNSNIAYQAEIPEIKLNSINNAKVTNVGTNATYNVNAKIENDAKIKLEATNTSGGDSIVEFGFTYQSVTTAYTIKIMQNSLQAFIRSVPRFTQTGEYKTEAPVTSSNVSYETFYIDKTSIENVFGGGRLFYANLNLEKNPGSYFFVFSKNEHFYASYPVYIDSSEFGTSTYFDLGFPFNRYEFKGIYSVNEFKDLKINAADRQINKADNNAASEEDLPDAQKDFTRTLIKEVEGELQYRLTQRIEVYYGYDNEGNQILVDFNKFGSNITENTPVKDTLKAFNIDSDPIKTSTISISYGRNDGSGITFNSQMPYYFKADIDVEVLEEAKEAGNYKEVEVWRQEDSIVEFFGIQHHTNSELVSSSDFTQGGGISFNIMDYQTGGSSGSGINGVAGNNTVLNKYIEKYKFGEFSRDINNHLYVMIEPRSIGGIVYDYRLTPQGAKNDGNFVLGQIKYSIPKPGSADNFEKTFYVVMLVKPDYEVDFGGYIENGENDDGQDEVIDGYTVVTNTLPYSVSTTGANYATINIAGGSSSYVSVKHKNATGEKQELSVSNFTITMAKDKQIGATTYNIKSNAQNKLGKTLPDQGALNLKGSESSISFQNVPKVVFGDQYYFVEAVDNYGFKYAVYFILVSSNSTPVVKDTITIKENQKFDIGVQYQELSILNMEEDKTPIYSVQASPLINPESTNANVKLITFSGIETWQWKKPEDGSNVKYSINGQNIQIDSKDAFTFTPNIEAGNDNKVYDSDGKFTGNDRDEDGKIKGKFLNPDSPYLKYPLLKYITLGNTIEIYNNGTKLDDTIRIPGNTTFATKSGGVFGAMELRDVRDAGAAFTMPRLKDTNVFKGANTVDLTLVFTFYYNGTEETYKCPVNITLYREAEVKVDGLDFAVQDGQAFTVSNKVQFVSGDSTINSTSYINDTLEVLVPEQGKTSFDLTLKRGGSTIGSVNVRETDNTGTSFAKTFYLSLSQYFETNVKARDTVEITNIQSNSQKETKFYYITNETSRTTAKSLEGGKITITIGDITDDVVYVENVKLLTGGSYDVFKYYIANLTYGSDTYSYRARVKYRVTGYVYQVEKGYTEDNFGILNNNTTNVATWNAGGGAFKLYKGTAIGNAAISRGTTITSVDYAKYFRFTKDLTDSGDSGGSAIVNENGTITVTSAFTDLNYVSVLVQLKVSGSGRGAEGTTYDGGYKNLITVKLKLK